MRKNHTNEDDTHNCTENNMPCNNPAGRNTINQPQSYSHLSTSNTVNQSPQSSSPRDRFSRDRFHFSPITEQYASDLQCSRERNVRADKQRVSRNYPSSNDSTLSSTAAGRHRLDERISAESPKNNRRFDNPSDCRRNGSEFGQCGDTGRQLTPSTDGGQSNQLTTPSLRTLMLSGSTQALQQATRRVLKSKRGKRNDRRRRRRKR